ncbi:MAG: DUF1131 family protein [Cocleimonas sp.]|nr:DUF1131 family protein [Cocleimonas sp.]
MTLKWIKFLLLFTLLSFISSCDNGTSEDYAEINDRRTSTSSTTIVLDKNKVGPIDAGSPFNIHHFTQAFQGFNVSQQTSFQEGEAYPVIRIAKGAKTLITINPNVDQTGIYSILIEDNLVHNQLGHRLGTLFSDVYSYGKVEKCRAGQEELSGKAICYAPKTRNILYIFSGRWSGPDGEIPPEKVLSTWALDAIIWKPIR